MRIERKGRMIAESARKGSNDIASMIVENINKTGKVLSEAVPGIGVGTGTGLNQGIPNGGEPKGVFPFISTEVAKRVYQDLFTQNLVGVQPMKGPYGAAFAIRNLYKTPTTERIEAAWKDVGRYTGYTGVNAGNPDEIGFEGTGTGVEAETAERWELGGDPAKGEAMPEVTIQMAEQSIVTKVRQLGAGISPIAIEHMKDMLNIDIVEHIIGLLKQEVAAEIDRETIAHCKAVTKPQIIKKGKTVEDGGATLNTLNGWNGVWSQQRIANIIQKIKAAANDISTATRGPAANIAVVSPGVATALEVAQGSFTRIQSNVSAPGAVAEIGNLGGTIRVFRDPNCVNPITNEDDNSVLLAYRGATNNDCGIVYCPYKLAVVQEAIDAKNMNKNIIVRSEYAYADSLLGADNYYRTLVFEGLTKTIAGNEW